MVFGQNKHMVDSLLNSLSKTSDVKQKCTILNLLFLEHVRSNLEKAAFYNDQSMSLALKFRYPRGIANAVNNKSHVFRIKGNYDSALATLQKAKPVFIELADSILYADYVSEIGNLYCLKEDPKNALINLVEGLKIYQKTGSTKNLALLYNKFGLLYKTQKQNDSALFYYKKSLEINEATGFKLGCSANLINIGIICEDEGNRMEAIGYFKQALKIKEQLGDRQGIVKCMINIGTAYMNLGNVKEAISSHMQSLKLAGEYHSNLDIAMSYVNLGFDYQKGKQYGQAIENAGKGYEVAIKINDLNLLRESARVLFESYDSQKNFKEAFKYHVLFKQYSDSIVNITNLKALTEIETKYNVAKKENEITSLKIDKDNQELQIQRLRAWYYLGFALFIALLALAFFFYYRSRASKKVSLKLKEINDAKSHFFANLSHEFRTPLTLMLGPAAKLMETAAPEDKPWLELIHRNATRLLFLDEQLLEFTKIDSGTQKIFLVKGNILVHLASIAETYTLLAKQKAIKYAFRLPDDPVEMFFDPDIVEKVTGNLISNAFKYTPEGGSIEVSVSTGPLDNNVKTAGHPEQEQNTFFRIDVTDTGIGIPESKHEVIFERFYQLNHNPGNTVGGAGIGLALTRELLALHHGSITLESTEGKGSRFSVILPMDKTYYPASELAEVRTYARPQMQGHAINFVTFPPETNTFKEGESTEGEDAEDLPQVLVVDDNADMRLYIQQVLNTHFLLSFAENGNEGFEIACNNVPDLIITDVMMYPVNGIEFCTNVKNDERTSHIPVIMLTALSGSQDKITGLETGADDYISKPFSPQELLIRANNLIAQRKKLRQLFSSAMNIEPRSITVTSADEKFLQKLILLIEDNIDNPDLDIEFLLHNIAMSRSQLHRKIKALTDQPITGFIRIIRIKRAAQLMEQKFGNVSDIMYAVGFNNLSYFTKSFREVYDMPPRDYMSK
jgi:signal transduction histidine kinase/CheY-like chemotaxis protein/AraC-like DNA-binding protein